jgi:hypothetical protein
MVKTGIVNVPIISLGVEGKRIHSKQLGERDKDRQDSQREHREKKEDKNAMVSSPNAIIYPGAMVIKVLDAFVTDIAMFASLRNNHFAIRTKACRLILGK